MHSAIICKIKPFVPVQEGAKIEIATIWNEVSAQPSPGQAPNLRNKHQEVCPNVMHEMKCV